MEKTEKSGPHQQSGSTNSPQFKWVANVKDRLDPITDKRVLIDRHKAPGDLRWGPSPPVRKYGGNWLGCGAYEIPAPGT